MSDLSKEAEALLRAARVQYAPQARDLDELREGLSRRLELALDAPTLAAPAHPVPPGLSAGAGKIAWPKLASVVALVSGLVLGGLVLSLRSSPSTRAPSVPQGVRALAVDSSLAHSTPGFDTAVTAATPLRRSSSRDPLRADAVRAPGSLIQAAPAAPAPALTHGASVRGARHVHRVKRSARQPTWVAAISTRPAEQRAALAVAPPALLTAKTTQAPPPVMAPVATAPDESDGLAAIETLRAEMRSRPNAPAADRLAEEIVLVGRARTLLEENRAEQALEQLALHATRFPHGALEQEELLLRVLALCELGQMTTARAVARRLKRTAADSPLVRRLASSCVLAD